MIRRLRLGSVCPVEVLGEEVQFYGPLLGGGREGAHRPHRLGLNKLMLAQVYHTTREFIMLFTFIITDGCTSGRGKR